MRLVAIASAGGSGYQLPLHHPRCARAPRYIEHRLRARAQEAAERRGRSWSVVCACLLSRDRSGGVCRAAVNEQDATEACRGHIADLRSTVSAHVCSCCHHVYSRVGHRRPAPIMWNWPANASTAACGTGEPCRGQSLLSDARARLHKSSHGGA